MKVEYIDHYGSDDLVVGAARVSFNKSPENYTEERNSKLIKYLADHEHVAPFFHPVITLRETVPIFIARQRFKHSVGFAYSEISRRYVDDTPEFYTPDVWRSRPEGSVKQGSGDGVIIPSFPHVDYGSSGTYEDFIDLCAGVYESLLKQGVAPEQARMVLPQSMMTSYYVTGSLYAFARAYNLRSDEHSQKEIQDLAAQWNQIIEPLFPHSWKALTA